MGIWVRDGTASVANGTKIVTGTLTVWGASVQAGNAISFDGGSKWYEIAALDATTPNVKLTLVDDFAETTITNGAYAIQTFAVDRTPLAVRMITNQEALIASQTDVIETTGAPDPTISPGNISDKSIAFDADAQAYYRKVDGEWIGPISMVGAPGASDYTALTNKPPGPTTQIFTSSGTWTKPAGCLKITATIVGGGGGGGGIALTTSDTYGAGGGGAGAAAITYLDVTSISSLTVTVGSAGSGGTAGGNGSSGGTSGLGTSNANGQATGGSGGFGRTTGSSSASSNPGGGGGTATNGSVNCGGQQGFAAISTGNAAGSVCGGAGGCSMLGGGGGAGRASQGAASPGGSATAPGSGGGGAVAASSTSVGGGGSGAKGIVIVEEYYA